MTGNRGFWARARANADSEGSGGGTSSLPPAVASALPSVVGLAARIPEDRRTARTLGTEREGHGILIDDDGLIVTIGYLIMEAQSVTITDLSGHELPARIVGYDYESGFGLVRTLRPPAVGPIRFGDSDSLDVRSEAWVAGVGGAKASLKVRVAGRREFAGYWEYLLDDALFTVPAYPLWGGSGLIGQDGTLLGVGSLLVQEALGPGAPAFPGNMFVPINRLKPIFDELLANGRISTPPKPWLGVYTMEHRGQLVIGGIAEGGPADRAGLKQGDVLLALNGEELDEVAEFYRLLWAAGPAGVPLSFRLQRDSDAFDMTIRSGDRMKYLNFESSL